MAWQQGRIPAYRLLRRRDADLPRPARRVRRAIAAERIQHRWQAGQVVVLDTFLMAHGRAPFSGPRKIALART